MRFAASCRSLRPSDFIIEGPQKRTHLPQRVEARHCRWASVPSVAPRGLAGTNAPPLSRRSAMSRRAYGNRRQSRWAYPPEPWILSAPLSAAGIAHPCARPLRRAPRGPARRAVADGRSAASQIRRAAGTRAQVDGMTGDRTPNHSSAPRLEPSPLGETQLRREANRAVVGGLAAERHRLVRKRVGEPVERRRARLGGIPASHAVGRIAKLGLPAVRTDMTPMTLRVAPVELDGADHRSVEIDHERPADSRSTSRSVRIGAGGRQETGRISLVAGKLARRPPGEPARGTPGAAELRTLSGKARTVAGSSQRNGRRA